MSLKRIKFLSRKKIAQKDVRIRVDVNGPSKRFSAALSLAGYGFPSEARIFVDAKQLLETIRSDWGTIAQPRTAAPVDISRLRGDRVTFNVVVVDGASSRKLGAAETVRPNANDETPDSAVALLPVDASARLDPLVWRIDFTDTDQEGHTDAPVLMLDSVAARGAASEFVQDPAVRSFVLPAAMREILTKLVLVDEHDYDPTASSWRDSWIRFAARLVGEDPPDNDGSNFRDDARDWISRAVERLAKRAAFLETYLLERGA